MRYVVALTLTLSTAAFAQAELSAIVAPPPPARCGDGGYGGCLDTLVAAEAASRPGSAVPYLQLPEISSRPARTSFTSTQSLGVPAEPVAEALSLFAEIAVERARHQGLGIVHERLRTATCALAVADLPPADGGTPLLPATCEAITNSSLERIVADPEPVTIAVTDDLIGAAGIAVTRQAGLIPKGASDPLKRALEILMRMSVRAVSRSVVRGRPTWSLGDSWALASTLINSAALVTRDDEVGAGLRAARVCIELKNRANADQACDPAQVVRMLFPGAKPQQLVDAVDLASTIIEAATASKGSGLTIQAAPQERVRAAIRVVFLIAAKVVEADDPTDKDHAQAVLGHMRKLLIAAVEGSSARMLTSGAELLIAVVDGAAGSSPKPAVRKATAVLSAVAAYGATFTTPTANAGSFTSDTRARRKEVLENLIDATTVRTNRGGEIVFSVGAPVGFSWIVDAQGGSIAQTGVKRLPQLSLPAGLSAQLLAGGRLEKTEWWQGAVPVGVHLMVTVLDLGQYLNYRADGQAMPPKIDTAITPGAQLGVILGWPDNAFIVGAEYRYAPDLAGAIDPTSSVPRSNQFRFFLAYYVPFFDFN